ncbi:hypothetical protein [Commensalibacter papalotli (ex Botero et al. 2024)]|uniref:DUF7210 family protein n=1 Tax=Commensalibacter papalotli (ex Botero et al. 2024) TaxID=2972766 RepID=UPI0022FF565A|nr:hypothetical protein [Commensalibacter papalotli (ex Botero et al. 2024)]CAI3945453.1 unnamed protein product [Commensalibacter papalotli (ex Botero et al. 2024)]
MAKDPKNPDFKDQNEGLPPELNIGDNPPGATVDNNPSPSLQKGSDTDVTKQNDQKSSAFFASTGTTTVTLMRNRTLYHNGVRYKGGTILDLPQQDADHLIKHHYAVEGSILPAGGVIIPQPHIPKEGSDVS